MPLYVDKKGSGTMYRSDKRLLLTADGQIVGPDDPRGVTLLVAEGGEIPYPDAVKYGLAPDPNASQKQEAAPKAEAASLPLPTSAEATEKVGDVLPKSLGAESKDVKAAPAKDAKSEKK